MRFQEAAHRFLDHRALAVESALFDECADLAIQTFGDSRFDSFHGSGPGPHGKKGLITPYRAAPAGLVGAPKVSLFEGGEFAAKGIQNECAVASIMCHGPILSAS
jgi:hypothetical protein